MKETIRRIVSLLKNRSESLIAYFLFLIFLVAITYLSGTSITPTIAIGFGAVMLFEIFRGKE